MAQQRESLRIHGEPKQYFYDCLILIEKDAVMLIMTSILQAVLFTRADLSNVTPLSNNKAATFGNFASSPCDISHTGTSTAQQ